MGLGVGGSSAILEGVMNLMSPFGGPVSLAICRGLMDQHDQCVSVTV